MGVRGLFLDKAVVNSLIRYRVWRLRTVVCWPHTQLGVLRLNAAVNTRLGSKTFNLDIGDTDGILMFNMRILWGKAQNVKLVPAAADFVHYLKWM